MKYRLTDETIEKDGFTLHRIQATKDFADVRKGYLGGFVENESNLSHKGNAWVYDDAKVYGNAQVWCDAQIRDNAEIYGNAWVWDKARVCDNARVHKIGRAHV